jgi:hypothetical protein
MKLQIIYDDGTVEEVIPKKVEVIQSEKQNLAHYKYVDEEKHIIFHAYLPTNEEPTVRPIETLKRINQEIESKSVTAKSYLSQADDLMAKAKMMSMMGTMGGPISIKCHYCGDPATNEYQGKKVCSSCFRMLTQYKENSQEFQKYLRNKVMDKWK